MNLVQAIVDLHQTLIHPILELLHQTQVLTLIQDLEAPHLTQEALHLTQEALHLILEALHLILDLAQTLIQAQNLIVQVIEEI